MKITKTRLKQIIKEALDDISSDDVLGRTEPRYFDDEGERAFDPSDARDLRDRLVKAIRSGAFDSLSDENMEFARRLFGPAFDDLRKQYGRGQ